MPFANRLQKVDTSAMRALPRLAGHPGVCDGPGTGTPADLIPAQTAAGIARPGQAL